jgi:tetratricopeptide (TPR) repeat protein
VPKQGIGGAVLATDLLAVATERLDRELVDDPAMAAELGMIFAGSYRALGFEQEAEPLLRATVARAERAFGADADLTRDARIELASAMLVRDPGGAVAMLGELRSGVLAGLPQGAARAIRLLRHESLALARLNRRVESYASLNRAIEIADRSLGSYADETIQLLGLLSGTDGRFGDREAQLRHATDALERATRAFGTRRPHNTLIATERAYADALRENDRPGDAVPILRRVLADQRQLDSAMTVRVRNATLQLGNALLRIGEAAEALELIRGAAAVERQHNAAETDERREYGDALAGALALGNRIDEALAQDAYLDGLVARLGGEPRGAAVYRRLRHARLLVFDGRPEEAARSVDAASAFVERTDTDLRFQVAMTRAFVLRHTGRPEEAEQRLLAMRTDPIYSTQRLALVAGVEAELGLAYLDLGRVERSAEPFARCQSAFRRAQIAPSVRVAGCLLGAARLQLAQGQPAAALRRLEPLLASWQAVNPGSPSHGETLYWIAQAQRALGATELAAANLRVARQMLAPAKARFLRRLA